MEKRMQKNISQICEMPDLKLKRAGARSASENEKKFEMQTFF